MTQQPWFPPQQNAANDVDPLAGGDSAPAVSFKNAPIGTMYRLDVTSQAKLVQSRDYETGDLDFWPPNPDGTRNPKMAVVINGTVNGEERSLWATKPSAMLAALQAAQKTAGQRIGPGGVLWVKLVGETPHPTNPRLNPKKEYVAKYDAPDALAGAPDFAQPAQQAAPPAAQQAAPPAAQPQQAPPAAMPVQQAAPPVQTQQPAAAAPTQGDPFAGQQQAAPQAQPAPPAQQADPFATAAPAGNFPQDPPF